MTRAAFRELIIERGGRADSLERRFADPVFLELPEPPAQTGAKGWLSQWRKVHRYKAAAWRAAIQARKPFTAPPSRVVFSALLVLHSWRDEPNLWGDLKPAIDALKQVPHSNDALRWKSGLFTMRGYFYDDDRAHFERGTVLQAVDRNARGLFVALEPVAGPDGAP